MYDNFLKMPCGKIARAHKQTMPCKWQLRATLVRSGAYVLLRNSVLFRRTLAVRICDKKDLMHYLFRALNCTYYGAACPTITHA
jgi:hypothetical protein